jgi:hypothetical protein
MQSFLLETTLSQVEIARRQAKQSKLERLSSSPCLTKLIDVILTLLKVQFKHVKDHDDSTLMFVSGETEIFVRRDWAYAGVAYHVCCWSAEGRPSMRIANPRQLRWALKELIEIQARRKAAKEFDQSIRLAFAGALHPRIGADSWARLIGCDGVRMCLGWV